ncbi:MAG: ferritin-like domain-containing protein [Myxococcales bacterium]|nr:ferritin-like domain-containing protein [Myxococcales bacterium]
MRTTLLLALGLGLTACGPGSDGTNGSSDSDDSGASSDSSATSSASTAGPGTDSGATSTGSGATESATDAPTTDATSTSSPTSTSGTTDVPLDCENAEPITQLGTDEPSGFERCENGVIHRAMEVACVEPQGVGNCSLPDGTCMVDDDCLAQDHGVCLEQLGGFPGCYCNYGCETDADCGPDQVCACAGVVSDHATCIPAGCVDSNDCGEGLCALAQDEGICGELIAQVQCIGGGAGCLSDQDCPQAGCFDGDPGMVQHVCWPQEGSWSCKPPEWCQGDCGRPLLIDGEVRTAPARPRDDWSLAQRDAPHALPPALARHLGERWTAIALLEHASIASFARFNLQLARLGAPPTLLAESRRAMTDELLHARLCFSLARRYRGRALGPGALPITGDAPCPREPAAIVETLIQEACVGETLAAAEARATAARSEDPTVRRALEQIAEDELRHAALGWRALRWILDRAGAEERAQLLATLARAVATARAELAASAGEDHEDATALAHGVPSDGLRARTRREALRELVEPCARELARAYDSAARAAA